MDATDSRNPINLETKINDSKKIIENSYVIQDHHLKKKL